MVGSIGEIVLAASVTILLAGLLRYTFGSSPRGALPAGEDEALEAGLLVAVATVPDRADAEVLAVRLREGRMRATVARSQGRWQVLVFPGDVGEARLALGSH